VAVDLGITSPNTRIRKVMMPVAKPTAWLGNRSMTTDVARAAAPTFTILFPIRIVVKSLWGFSLIFSMSLKNRSSSLARYRILVLLIEKSEVSAEEKNPDKASNTIRIII
jgi:hypothetical protein